VETGENAGRELAVDKGQGLASISRKINEQIRFKGGEYISPPSS
jgi:hypothetical protein